MIVQALVQELLLRPHPGYLLQQLVNDTGSVDVYIYSMDMGQNVYMSVLVVWLKGDEVWASTTPIGLAHDPGVFDLLSDFVGARARRHADNDRLGTVSGMEELRARLMVCDEL